jgi:hypothetical protein
MKALHIQDVDSLVIKRIGQLARLHQRFMQAELRVFLEEASRRAEALEAVAGDDLVFVSISSTASYGRQDIYADDTR